MGSEIMSVMSSVAPWLAGIGLFLYGVSLFRGENKHMQAKFMDTLAAERKDLTDRLEKAWAQLDRARSENARLRAERKDK